MKKKVIIYIPAHDASKALRKTVSDIPPGIYDEIILVDNASRDNTVEIAESLGLTVIRHENNKGYGGSQKTGFRVALKKGADIIVMLHSDGQYNPKLLPQMLEPLCREEADCVFGSRFLNRDALAGGMPLWRYVANRFLTIIENMIVGSNLSEFHSGYRLYTRKLLESIPYENNSDNWLFDSEIIIQVVHFGFKIKELPIPTCYNKNSSSMSFKEGVVYGLGVFKAIGRYVLHRSGIWQTPQYKIKDMPEKE